jgi:hypothetical protein
MSVLAQLRPENRNSPGRIRAGLWPNILETLSDSVRDPLAARLPVCGRGFAGFDFQIVGGSIVTRGRIRYPTLPYPTFNLRFLVPGRALTC